MSPHKSSGSRGASGIPTNRLSTNVLPTFITVGIATLGMLGVARLQPALAFTAHEARQDDDTILVPPPGELRAMTLGHTAATVDYLWGKTLVEYGSHVAEKRPFEIERYLEAIYSLEPDYRPLYLYADTLLAYRPPRGYAMDARKAHALLQRGTEARSTDPEVWLHYGQFSAFMGRSFLDDPREIEAWRHEGAEAIAHAVELGADADRSLAATSILRRYGENDAAIKHLQRAYALTDSDATREQIRVRLEQLQVTVQVERSTRAWEQDRRQHGAFVKPLLYRLMGPLRDSAACAGPSAADLARCKPNFADE